MHLRFSSDVSKNITFTKLPSAETVNARTSEQFTGALRHDQSNSLYDANVRQLLHVGFKVAAMMSETYIKSLHDNREVVSPLCHREPAGVPREAVIRLISSADSDRIGLTSPETAVLSYVYESYLFLLACA